MSHSDNGYFMLWHVSFWSSFHCHLHLLLLDYCNDATTALLSWTNFFINWILFTSKRIKKKLLSWNHVVASMNWMLFYDSVTLPHHPHRTKLKALTSPLAERKQLSFPSFWSAFHLYLHVLTICHIGQLSQIYTPRPTGSLLATRVSRDKQRHSCIPWIIPQNLRWKFP